MVLALTSPTSSVIRYNSFVLHVSIVLVHFNSDAYTRSCLESLQAISSRLAKFQVVVVDNASKEPYQLPEHLEQSNVTLIRSESNLGFTGGNNLGMAYAIEHFNSDFILLLNNDTVVDAQFLDALVKTALTQQKIGVVTSKIYFAAGSEFHTSSYRKDELGRVLWFAGGSIDDDSLVCFHRGVDEVDYGQFDHAIQTDFATGCAMLIKREVLEKVGMFDRRFFLYLEDVDLSVRAQAAGYQLAFCPESLVWHANAGSSDGVGSTLHTYYQTRNRFLFALKHPSANRLLTAVRLALQYLLHGNQTEKLGLFHALTNQFGKQIV